MANQSHNMVWKDVKQEEDPFPVFSTEDYFNHIHDNISSRDFSMFENWDLDLLQQQPLFVNDPNILLMDDPYDPLEMFPESSFIPDYSLLPSSTFDMELEPINSYLGEFEDYIYNQLDLILPFHDDDYNNNNVVICQQNYQMPLMSSVTSHETLAVSDHELVWPEEENNNTTGRRRMVRAGAKRSREDNTTTGGDNNYSKAITLSREAISEYFYMPITQAAKEMNIGLTLLKKRCREVGIRRWPHRKLMSLQTLINNVQEMGDGMEKKKSKVVVEMLEKEMKLMEQVPDRELGENTKKLRQACFKANYKKRKLNSADSWSSSMLLTAPESPATASSLVNYYNSSYVG